MAIRSTKPRTAAMVQACIASLELLKESRPETYGGDNSNMVDRRITNLRAELQQLQEAN